MERDLINIDGSYGEGGGQILRTALALSAITGKPFRMEKIRAGRKNPGLQAQHLTAVLACAEICGARVEGEHPGSPSLTFTPQSPPQPGKYTWDVRQARKGGSAGSAPLILHTVLYPLALADGDSQITIQGGTHVPFSPPYHYLAGVLIPALAKIGVSVEVALQRWGWYPQGGGVIHAQIRGRTAFTGIAARERGQLIRLRGLSAVSNLPLAIAQRQSRRVEEVLKREGLEIEIEIISAPALGPGTCVFLWAEFANLSAGTTALGARGKSAERVAEEAAGEFLSYFKSGAALDMHLADQLLLPLVLAATPSHFTTCRITRHLLTNIWTVGQFLPLRFEVQGKEGEPGEVWCYPARPEIELPKLSTTEGRV